MNLFLLGVLAAGVIAGQTSAIALTAEDLQKEQPPANSIRLESMNLGMMSQEWGGPQAGKSVDRHPIMLKGVKFGHGVGTHARSEMLIDLKGAATGFASVVGVDDEEGTNGSVVFEVWADGKKKADSGIMRGGESGKLLTVDLTGAKKLYLLVTNGGDNINNDHADWAGAVITLVPGTTERPAAVTGGEGPAIPIFSTKDISPKPAIRGPRIVGTTPGRPFIFLVPATGKGPLTFSAKNLPEGLSIDPGTGVITGSIKKTGKTTVELAAKGPEGTGKRKLVMEAGNGKLAQTPPLGWNSWNVWGGAVDDAKVRAAADWMVKSGLASHGFQYINIDDCWQAGRDANGEVTCNEKFPDMKALADYVHSKGLKLGIYSSPGPKTCGGYEGSYQHEEQDAKTWAKWGIDYVKYDWCSYTEVASGPEPEKFKKPYRVLRSALDKCDRDIVYSFCQYGMANVWEWGDGIGGNCWRTTGDITDSWASMSGIGFSQDGHEKYTGPGHWNDPDMLVVGKVGWGPNVHPTRLTPNEQITHITLWSLLSSPLLIGCDLSDMHQFTVDILSNDEVLDINQDPLGKPADRKVKDTFTEVWARPLWDGTMAVGLFNRNFDKAKVTAKWSDLGLKGSQPVRDLWLQKDLGKFDGSFSVEVPAHGAMLVKVGKAK